MTSEQYKLATDYALFILKNEAHKLNWLWYTLKETLQRAQVSIIEMNMLICQKAEITASPAALCSCNEDFASKGKHAIFSDSHKNQNRLTDEDEIMHNCLCQWDGQMLTKMVWIGPQRASPHIVKYTLFGYYAFALLTCTSPYLFVFRRDLHATILNQFASLIAQQYSNRLSPNLTDTISIASLSGSQYQKSDFKKIQMAAYCHI